MMSLIYKSRINSVRFYITSPYASVNSPDNAGSPQSWK